MNIKYVASALVETTHAFNCSFDTAWKKYMHPAITERFTFEEVMKQIKGE
ncbi:MULTISPECIES: hypothetical protein [Paenibacillus]|uniref:Uncharacterized protein n=1 Tax=Paenibacillus alvei TaxID=44250 RepID=A0A383RH63_PAEAL|nr:MULTISPECIES: hypothetical protein [Paenibacillus]SYX85922.1 conserved protein of unknown function [Paenibacillus alvei]